VVEQENAANNALPGIHGDQAIDLSAKTTGDLVVELLNSARSRLLGALTSAGKEASAGFYRKAGSDAFDIFKWTIVINSPGIFSFILKNADALKEFVDKAWHNPALNGLRLQTCGPDGPLVLRVS
jgi:hypothetical protein